MSFTHSNGRSRIVMGVHACFTLFHGVSRTPLPAEQNRHKKCIQFTLSCQELSGVVRSCQELGVVRSCQELSGAVRSCQELSGAVRVVRSCQELSGVISSCQDQELSGAVRSCQELPGRAFVQSHQDYQELSAMLVNWWRSLHFFPSVWGPEGPTSNYFLQQCAAALTGKAQDWPWNVDIYLIYIIN